MAGSHPLLAASNLDALTSVRERPQYAMAEISAIC
jgi:hypothetical protein